MKALTILGSTGSIGLNTLDVVAGSPDRFRVFALTAHSQDELMAEQVRRFRPVYAVMADAQAAERLRARLRADGGSLQTEVLAGAERLAEVSAHPEVDYVMAAIVGAAGLLPTLAAARAGKRVLLANKEALVMSGALFMDAVREGRAELLPIDSEHNAVFQCMPPAGNGELPRVDGESVRRVVLTASGGPFRNRPLAELGTVSPAEACAHPNWVMGRKISVDSATMMNKGLEVIEACWLFGTGPEAVQVVVHPQSVIHSMVEYADGSVLAQMGNPDMRTPIAHALAWPDRIQSGAAFLDLVQVARLDFEAADLSRFPCLALGFEAARGGGALSAVLNAANEVAVDAFLEERIGFLDIPRIIERTLQAERWPAPDSLDVVLEIDRQSRARARALCRVEGEPGARRRIAGGAVS